MSITINHLEYFDKRLHTHWYWQDLAQEIAKWHLSSVEALLSSKFWKQKWKWPYLLNWVEYCVEILHTNWQDVAQEIVSCHLGDFAEVQILKNSEPDPISWTVWYILIKILHTHYYWQDCQMSFIITPKKSTNVIWQILKKVKLALEAVGIFW